MITKSDIVKIWSISLIDLVFLLLAIIFYKTPISALSIILMLTKLAFTYLVTVKNKKFAVWLWVALLLVTSVIDLTRIPSEVRLIVTLLFVTFLTIIIRCFLQWSAILWRSANRQISQKLLNFYIYFESVLLMISTDMVLSLSLPEKYYKAMSGLFILVLILLYRKIKRNFSTALNGYQKLSIKVEQ